MNSIEGYDMKRYLIAIALALITWSFALIAPTAHAQSVTSLACSPSIIGGGSGGSATCTVTLSAAAPSSGTRVALTSSLIELAASVPSVTVLGGQTTANFTVTTNANYRRYSLLAFNATISATNEATASATLSVTAQARPADFFSDSGNNLNFGKVCGGSYPAPRAEFGILFNCNQGPQGVCMFLQECTLGCKEALHVSGQADNDFCPTTPPLPFALDQKYVVGGNAATGTLSFANPSQAAPNDTRAGVGSSSLFASAWSNVLAFAGTPPAGIPAPLPTGTTSQRSDILTAPVNAIQFAGMDSDVTQPEDGATFFAARRARSWLAVVPGASPPVNLISLNLASPAVVGGFLVNVKVCIDQLQPAPEIGVFPLAIASSNPAVAAISAVPVEKFVEPGQKP